MNVMGTQNQVPPLKLPRSRKPGIQRALGVDYAGAIEYVNNDAGREMKNSRGVVRSEACSSQ